MLRRRWAFDQNVDAVRDWYHKRLDQIGWSYLGAISFEAWPVVFDNFQLDQGPLPPAGETRPQEFQLSFLSAEEPDPPQDYWPDDGSTPALHFQTKLIVPSTSRRLYPQLTAEIWRDGRFLGLGGEWMGVVGFNGIQDERERSKISGLFAGAAGPEIDVAHAWDEEDVNYIQSREKFRWFIETFLPSMGYETTLDEEQHLSS